MSAHPLAQVNLQEQVYRNYKDLHKDSSGIICISQITEGKWKNKYGRYRAMLKYLGELESQDELFYSQNTFKKFKRSTEYLFELKALYIDLDFHKKTNYTREQVLGSIGILVDEGKIPSPTHVIDSGYGLNLIWRIKKTPAQALPLWRTIEEYFYKELEFLGADRQALDVTRVFRVDGTYNAKYMQRKKVNVLYSCPESYDIHLIQQYVQFQSPKVKKPKQSKTVKHLYNQYTLYYSRYQDILTICKLRNYDVTGYREVILFLYRYYGCAYLQNEELALSNALDLNSQFTEPLSEIEVIRATRSGEKAAQKMKYGYRNQTLIDLLDITDKEMQKQDADGSYYMKSIITKEEKYRRNNKRRYDEKRNEKGHTKEQERQLSIIEQVEQLRASGMKQAEVAKRLGVNIRTVQKYEKKIREQKESKKSG